MVERGMVSFDLDVRVNGRRKRFEYGITVFSLLQRLEITAQYALVEINGIAVSRDEYTKVELQDGDEIVIARPVPGG